MTRSLIPLLGLVLACSPHDVTENPAPPVELPASYGSEVVAEAQGPAPERWWRDFGDPELNRLVEQTLKGNFDLHGAWARLAQAEAIADSTGAPRYPTLDASAGVERSHYTFPTPTGQGSRTTNSASGSLKASYEVDIWDKLGSAARAAALDREAALDGVQSIAMSLAAEVAETWFDLVRARGRLALLTRQLEVNETFLDLVKLRFGQGQASAVDVNQQRQQVLATRARLAQQRADEEVLGHRLAVLLGRPPGKLQTAARDQLPLLPPLPDRGVPSELLKRRPDVRAAQRSVEAADHRIAAAVSDRYPSLRLTGELRTQPNELNNWALDPLWNLVAGLTMPIFDGGRRAAEADRTRAVLAERVSDFGKVLLTAMLEVENALVLERRQQEHLEQIRTRSEVAGVTLEAARTRYSQGIDDFLTVLTVLEAQQQVELSLLDAERQLLSYRIQLCRALGGTWAAELSPPPGSDEEDAT